MASRAPEGQDPLGRAADAVHQARPYRAPIRDLRHESPHRSPAAIARTLGRHRSTIGREIQRNRAHSDGTYRPQIADWYARSRRSRSRRKRQCTRTEWAQIQELLREDWSPEQVAGWLRRHQLLTISHETTYRYI